MVSYEKWNKVLCEHFFNESNSGKIIYLYVNEKLIIDLAMDSFGISERHAVDSFRKCVFDLSPIVSRIFKVGYYQSRCWYNKGMKDKPPFIVLLALCVFAATKMESDQEEGIGGGNYYYRLRELLDATNEEGIIPYFEKTEELWNWLKAWQEQNDYKYGFTPSFSYGTRYTGYPRSQCLIRDSERILLHEFFEWANYDSKTIVNSEKLRIQLSQFLKSRGGRLSKLFFMKKQSYQKHIVSQILIELENWQQNYDDKSELLSCNSSQDYKKFQIGIDMSLILKFEGRLSRRLVDIYFLGRLNKDGKESNNFKIDGIELKYPFIKKELYDFEEIMSTFQIDIEEQNLSIQYKGNDILFFSKGDIYGINGWVSSRCIKPNMNYLILCEKAQRYLIDDWLALNDIKVDGMIVKGCPKEYIILMITTGETVNYFERIETTGKYFSVDRKVQIDIDGGLKISRNEWLFDFPFNLRIIAPSKTEVKLNGIPSFSLLNEETIINSKDLNLTPGSHYITAENSKRCFQLIKNKEINQEKIHAFFDKDHSKNIDFSCVGLREVKGNKFMELLAHPRNQNYYQLISNEKKIADFWIPNYLIKAQPYSPKFSELILKLNLSHNFKWRPIDTFIEYLSHLGKGNRLTFVKGIKQCLGEENINLKVYLVKKNLTNLGFIEVEHQLGTNQFYWRITPIAAGYIPCNYQQQVLYVAGARTKGWLELLEKNCPRGINIYYHNPKSGLEPLSLYITSRNEELLNSFLGEMSIFLNDAVNEYYALELAKFIPTIEEKINTIPPINIELTEFFQLEGWDLTQNQWVEGTASDLLRIKTKYYNKYFLKHNDAFLKVDNEFGKIVFAARRNKSIFRYEPYVFFLRREYSLPGLYERVLTLCSGVCPTEFNCNKIYKNVPLEIALILTYKLGFKELDY